MEVERRYLEYQRLQEDSRALKFLRSRSFDYSAAVLGTYFTDKTRRITVDEFHVQLAADIDILALRDPDIRQKATQLTTKWVNAGIIARRQELDSKTEYFELTRAGQMVLDFIQQIDLPKAKATQSRLTSMTQAAVNLELQTNPDKTLRIQSLKNQKAAIDKQIELIEAGHLEIMPRQQVIEGIIDLAHQAREVPADFLRVRDEFESINRSLRRDLLESEDNQAKTLEEVFLGIDRVRSSEAGQSFEAFFKMLLDEERQLAFDHAIEQLTQRGYFADLSSEDQYFLNDYAHQLRCEALPVREVMTTLSRNLRQFVQSRQFQQFRALMEKITLIQRLGMEAADKIKPQTELPLEIQFSSLSSQSVGRLRLQYPLEERVAETPEIVENVELDLEELRRRVRESEIDFTELTKAINDTLTNGPADIATVLENHPATQGIASIIGLINLGMKYGKALEEETEVEWTGQFDGVRRRGRISNYRFTQLIN